MGPRLIFHTHHLRCIRKHIFDGAHLFSQCFHVFFLLWRHRHIANSVFRDFRDLDHFAEDLAQIWDHTPDAEWSQLSESVGKIQKFQPQPELWPKTWRRVASFRDMPESGLYAGLIPNPGAQIKNKCQIHVQYDHTKILSHYLPYFESKNMCDPTLTPLIMTSSTYDVIETPRNLFG